MEDLHKPLNKRKAQTSPYSPTGLRQPSINYGKPAYVAQASMLIDIALKSRFEVAVRRRN